jgi:hypothetical protein
MTQVSRSRGNDLAGKTTQNYEACEFEAKKGKYSSHTASSFKN